MACMCVNIFYCNDLTCTSPGIAASVAHIPSQCIPRVLFWEHIRRQDLRILGVSFNAHIIPLPCLALVRQIMRQMLTLCTRESPLLPVPSARHAFPMILRLGSQVLANLAGVSRLPPVPFLISPHELDHPLCMA